MDLLKKRIPVTITAAVVAVSMCAGFFAGRASMGWNDTSAVSESSAAAPEKAKAENASAVTSKTENIKKASAEPVTDQKQIEEKKKAEEQKRKQQEKAEKERLEKERLEKEKRLKEWRDKQDGIVFTSENMVEPEWFDDVLFVGDSVTVALSSYSDFYGCFGDAEFLAASSLGYDSALWDINDPNNVHPLWKGKKVTVDAGVKLSEKTKIIIMFGMNDIGTWGVEQAVTAMKQLSDRILQRAGYVDIYIQGVTPMLKSVEKDNLNNKLVTEFNAELKKVCDERGYHFIDITPAVCDDEGALIADYCADPDEMGMHLNYDGCERWARYLYAHILDDGEPRPGIYSPETIEDLPELENYTFIDETQESKTEESDDDTDDSSDDTADESETDDDNDEYEDYGDDEYDEY